MKTVLSTMAVAIALTVALPAVASFAKGGNNNHVAATHEVAGDKGGKK